MPLKLTFVTLALATAALAAPPVPKAPAPSVPPRPSEKVAWLGLTTREVPAVLAAQLDLPDGTGLVVEMVLPDGPAAKAGVLINDILTKLDDQILVNPHQLATLVRIKKAGDKVQLTLLRKGKAQTLTATLETHTAASPAFDTRWRPSFVPAHPNTPDALPRVWVTPSGPAGSVIIQSSGGSAHGGINTSQFSDGEHTITITSRDGQKTVSVQDSKAQVIYDGPYNTDEEKAKVPAEIRPKIKQMEEGKQRIPSEMFPPPPMP